MDWPTQISTLALVKSKIADCDKRGIWPYHLPRTAASKAELSQVERHLDGKLPSGYVSFLLHANGWPGFYQTVDLFGTSELMGSKSMVYAMDMLSSIESTVLKISGFSSNDVLPIAATTSDLDLFVIGKPTSAVPGTVVWYAGQEIERFASFDDFFMAMIDYNRRELVAMEG